ncbi:MAG TPA: HU family DNA-binding protein [Acidobacteriota bacterium]|jgi:DNA-binding protein HU-beta|nr:HU family DNA-binding protein [Acidobacteriota bacterium]HRR27175.1 HU family DNA-binding protein [Acidobacteriota bacterium]HRR57684.1 HU family DNA-binding protein [Acidobacteriota bacterium]
MNKGELVDAVAKDTGLPKSQAQAAVDAVIDNITKALKKGQKVTLVGFGTFAVSKREAREGRNPRTGRPIKIPAKKVAKFAAGKSLKDSIN